ncbi:sulfatase [Coraliomargarita sp. SDUM461003]|uniref:Sulfatase n=1 Tax=Thalassobacterium maritimum TaxID=3041265 RepID=A0ABU1AQC5_9BACT|nr:sulfatase [Coraliomargarita sp. SDUM461003]MDQ8206370.1 sulfatase [Coraliomargarita sp. SDUM461003]
MQNIPPNIVFIVSDDHGREALGCYGNPVIQTPHLDRLAAEGVLFNQAFCTTPSCAASRSAMLTGNHNHSNGTYGHTHGQHHFACFDDVVTLPRLLNEAGYRTGCIGKKHFAPESVYPFQTQLGEHTYLRDDVRMAEACTDFVGEDSPFFLYWCSYNPHRTGNSKSGHSLKPNDFGNPDESFPGDEEQVYDEAEVIVPSWLPDNEHTRAELAQYYQSISRLDRGVGRLMEVLKEQGVYDNTLIVYLADNGAAFPGSKTTLYDPGMQLPCIIKSPAQEQGGVEQDGLIAWYDIAPTILDYAGIVEKSEPMFGQSFRALLENRPADWTRREIYASHTFHEITNYYPMRVVRSHKHKFIWNVAHPLTFSFASDLWDSATWSPFRGVEDGCFGERRVADYLHRPCFELYDLEADPGELTNLADQPEYQELVESFCAKIKKFQAETNDPWLHKWEYE